MELDQACREWRQAHRLASAAEAELPRRWPAPAAGRLRAALRLREDAALKLDLVLQLAEAQAASLSMPQYPIAPTRSRGVSCRR